MASNLPRGASRQLARGRLPSLLIGRDLTLGGATRKKFVPNIAASNTTPNNIKLGDGLASERGRGGRGRGRGQREDRGGRGQGRGRGRGRAQLIQSEGSIFAEGPAQKLIHRRGARGYSSNDLLSTDCAKPKIDASVDFNYVKEEEENTLRELTRDDFIDDGNMGEGDESLFPVHLATRQKKATESKVKLKSVKSNSSPVKQKTKKETVKIKKEPLDVVKMEVDSDDDDIEAKLRRMMPSDDEEVEEKEIMVETKLTDTKSVPVMTPADIFSDDNSGDLILFQVPDYSFAVSNAMEKLVIKQEPGVVPNTTTDEKPQTTDPSTAVDGLANCQDGLLGKIQVLKSGRVRLTMRTGSLNLEMSSNCGILQNAVLAECGGTSGNFADLGHISCSLVCTPNIQQV